MGLEAHGEGWTAAAALLNRAPGVAAQQETEYMGPISA
jgi:hypothetical protein